MTDPTDPRAVADDPSSIVQKMPEVRFRADGRCSTDSTMRHFAYAVMVPDPDGDYVEYEKARATEADLRAEVVRLKYALAQAAVPLEGLTLAAHMTESDMGLCKGTWNEINNAVAHIRAALSPETDGGHDV